MSMNSYFKDTNEKGAGREVAKAYVEFTHYVERLYMDVWVQQGTAKRNQVRRKNITIIRKQASPDLSVPLGQNKMGGIYV